MPADSNNVINLKKRKKQRNKAAQKRMHGGDFWIFILVFLLVVFGVVMVFSASYYYAISKHGNPYYYLFRGILWAVLGFAAMLILTVVDYHKLRKLSFPFLIISIGMLIVLLFPSLPFVVELNGQARWINVFGITLMPGEIAKAAVILFMSVWLTIKPGMILKFKEGILPMIIVTGVFAGLIGANNLMTALTLAVIAVGIMFMAGLRWKWIAATVIAGGFGVAGLIIVEPYRVKRIMSFLDPFADPQGTGYQVVQGLLALGSGGLFGLGLGKSVQKTLYLPEPQNDFIYAIIGEELGFVFLLFLLAAYLLLIWRCVYVSMNAPDMFGTLLGSGITVMLASQVILNVMVVTSIAPPTGIILPFVSWGGNALLIFMGSMGIILNISRQIPR